MFHLPTLGRREKGEGRVPAGAEILSFAPMVSEMGYNPERGYASITLSPMGTMAATHVSLPA